jgi:leucyl/phenylalanyl-tRNA--protein transferase
VETVAVYVLHPRDESFPPAAEAEPHGLLAVGGDLRPSRLLKAYAQGIFPWYSDGLPILWHSPDPRYVLEPKRIHLPKSLKKNLRQQTFQVRYDTDFAGVIDGCAQQRGPDRESTWITSEMREAYCELHRLGFAHSVESWREGTLQGGLYGVALGTIFFGESMFTLAPDASKVALATLAQRLVDWGFVLIDCQVYTPHLARFGAEAWPRERYLGTLQRALQDPTRRGSWDGDKWSMTHNSR